MMLLIVLVCRCGTPLSSLWRASEFVLKIEGKFYRGHHRKNLRPQGESEATDDPVWLRDGRNVSTV